MLTKVKHLWQCMVVLGVAFFVGGCGDASVLGDGSVLGDASVLDTTEPTVGTGIVFFAVTDVSTTVIWGAASDDVTLPADLEYKLVTADSSAAIDTVAEAGVLGWTTRQIALR